MVAGADQNPTTTAVCDDGAGRAALVRTWWSRRFSGNAYSDASHAHLAAVLPETLAARGAAIVATTR